MRIVLPREEFLEAVSWTARILPMKPYTPVLGGVYIIADGGDTHFCAYDTEVSAEMQAKAEIGEEGEALVSGRLLAAISRTLPKADVELQGQGNSVLLRCGRAEFTLPTMPVGAYPKLPDLPDTTATIDGDTLAEALNQVLPAVSQDQALPALCTVYAAVVNDQLSLWATDKHRMATRVLPWKFTGDTPPARMLIPARAAAEMARLTGEVSLGFSLDATGILGVSAGTRMSTTRLMDGKFPNCGAIMPNHHSTVIVIDSDDLRGALQRAMLLDDSEFPRVRFQGVNDGLLFTAGTAGVGGVVDTVAAETRGPAITFTVNPRYVLEAVNACHSEKVAMGFTAPLKPVLMTPFTEWPEEVAPPNDTYGFVALQSDYRHIVMPTLPGDPQ